MVHRSAIAAVRDALDRQPAAALLGPRQVGKTTLAHAIADETPSVYLDLEAPQDRAKLNDPALFLKRFEDRLVILDEIHRVPEVFPALRGLIDEGRRRGHRTGRFLILGSASLDLMRQSSESLAGRIAYIEMAPILSPEAAAVGIDQTSLWLRGGFPESLFAGSDKRSLAWRKDFIRSYLERDVPMLGPRIPAETLERLWTMLAHEDGALLNASRFAASLMIAQPTVTRYIDLLVDLLLVRRLRPYHVNAGKRLVKSPKTYVRDSGLVHALLGIPDLNALAGHPVSGGSWEGFIIENLIHAAPDRTTSSFYRTSAGAEIDLLLEIPGHGLWAFEIKRGLTAKPQKGFYIACEDVKPARRILVNSGTDPYPLSSSLEAMGINEAVSRLAAL